MAFFLIVALTCIWTAQGHMSMSYPHPRTRARTSQTDCNSPERSQKYLTWEWNEPQEPVRPCTCHGTFPDPTIQSGNVLTAGSTITVKLAGTAFHNGGHCSFWWSIDGVTFKKFVDVKDCTTMAVNNQPINIVIPAGVDTACGNRCILGWTWTPTSSGGCEIYMTCADVRIVGATGGGTPIQVLNFDTQISSSTCVRVNPTTHWSQLFSPVSTTGMSGGGGGPVPTPRPTMPTPQPVTQPVANPVPTPRPTMPNTGVTVPPQALCKNPATPNWGTTTPNGQCGPNVGNCDAGMCCSSGGYCGPELRGYDSAGNPVYNNYDVNPPGAYANAFLAFDAYCKNAQGDFRMVPCCAIVNGVHNPALDSCYQGFSGQSTTASGSGSGGGGSGSTNTACADSTTPCSIQLAMNSNKWWLAVTIRNTGGNSLTNIKSVEARGGGQTFISGVRQTWFPNPWALTPGGSGFNLPISLKITLEDNRVFYACNTITSYQSSSPFSQNVISSNLECIFSAGFQTGSSSSGSTSQGTTSGSQSSSSSGNKTDVGLIVGLSVTGLVLVACIVGGCVVVSRRKNSDRRGQNGLLSDYQ